MDQQEHFGRKFNRDRKSGYWLSTDSPRIRAHRWVWNCNFGVIPKGYHIHHKDHDKGNNDITNLEMIKAEDHLRLHMTPERRRNASKFVGEIRHLTKAWHASAEGKAWHKFHALKCKFGKNESIPCICQVCSKNYTSFKIYNTKFCSNSCKSQFRRNSGLDNETRICKFCSNGFVINRYAKGIFCDKVCKGKWTLSNPKPLQIRNCELCKKEFKCKPWRKTRFCGYSCSGKNNAISSNK